MPDVSKLQRSYRGMAFCFMCFFPCTILAFTVVFAALRRHDRLHRLELSFDLAQLEQNINEMPDSPKKKDLERIMLELEQEQ